MEWISVKEKMPEYYETVWATDGVAVILAMKVGRSHTPQKEIWRNVERNGCRELYDILFWKPCVRPTPPQVQEEL